MDALNAIAVETPFGTKTLSVHCCELSEWHDPLDVMTVSAFYRNYVPVQRTLMGTLFRHGIRVEELSCDPAIDLRDLCNIWLSREVGEAELPFGRIGCIEMTPLRRGNALSADLEKSILSSIHAYFLMLELASGSGIPVRSLGLPILGGGNQGISSGLVNIPILNECLGFLRRNPDVHDIHVITRNQRQAYEFARSLDTSYSLAQNAQSVGVARRGNAVVDTGARRTSSEGASPAHPHASAFISYSSSDKNVADNLCAKLESNGIKAWYAPRDIRTGDYASAIVDAISCCTHFIVIVSQHSLQSQHVLNEIDLAFQRLGKDVRICPLRIDEEEMGPAFTYYLSRQHWMDAHIPPLERRLEEFVGRICSE